MRSPASSTSPRAPSKPTWPASCASSAPETASSSPCGPTRPDASDTAEAPPPFAAPHKRHEDHPDKTKPGPPLFAVAPAFRQLDPGNSPRPLVEVAGIEPASSGAIPG